MRRLMHVVVVAALAALCGAALARGRGADTAVIHGCTTIENNPILLAPSAGCTRGQNALDWNISGPAGPAGPQGPQGPAGPQGAQGPAGPSTTPVYKVFTGKLGSSGYNAAGGGYWWYSASAYCPDKSWVALNGGYYTQFVGPTAPIVTSNHIVAFDNDPTATPQGWRTVILWPKPSNKGLDLTAYVLCLKMS